MTIKEELALLDHIDLNFNESGLFLLNIAIGFIMFGVALQLKKSQFAAIYKQPKAILVGLFSQYISLPVLTILLVLALKQWITPGVAFGMILVAACPGGNISNFISSYAKGNVALSVSLTAIATIASIVMTPLNFSIYGSIYAASSPLLRPIEIDPVVMFKTVFVLLGIPVLMGTIFSRYFPKTTKRIEKPMQMLSIVIFLAFVVVAFQNNFDYFIKYIKWIFLIVLLHNTIAYLSGYGLGRFMGLSQINRRTISIETGIQNSGLGLVLLFNPDVFPADLQLGGMACIAAWWGIWHMISGLGLAYFWSHKKRENVVL